MRAFEARSNQSCVILIRIHIVIIRTHGYPASKGSSRVSYSNVGATTHRRDAHLRIFDFPDCRPN